MTITIIIVIKIISEEDIDFCTICIEKNIERVILMNDISFSKQDGIKL